MKMNLIQTIIVACSWCSKMIDVKSVDSESDKFLIISHGMCRECYSGQMREFGLEEEPNNGQTA